MDVPNKKETLNHIFAYQLESRVLTWNTSILLLNVVFFVCFPRKANGKNVLTSRPYVFYVCMCIFWNLWTCLFLGKTKIILEKRRVDEKQMTKIKYWIFTKRRRKKRKNGNYKLEKVLSYLEDQNRLIIYTICISGLVYLF